MTPRQPKHRNQRRAPLVPVPAAAAATVTVTGATAYLLGYATTTTTDHLLGLTAICLVLAPLTSLLHVLYCGVDAALRPGGATVAVRIAVALAVLGALVRLPSGTVALGTTAIAGVLGLVALMFAGHLTPIVEARPRAVRAVFGLTALAGFLAHSPTVRGWDWTAVVNPPVLLVAGLLGVAALDGTMWRGPAWIPAQLRELLRRHWPGAASLGVFAYTRDIGLACVLAAGWLCLLWVRAEPQWQVRETVGGATAVAVAGLGVVGLFSLPWPALAQARAELAEHGSVRAASQARRLLVEAVRAGPLGWGPGSDRVDTGVAGARNVHIFSLITDRLGPVGLLITCALLLTLLAFLGTRMSQRAEGPRGDLALALAGALSAAILLPCVVLTTMFFFQGAMGASWLQFAPPLVSDGAVPFVLTCAALGLIDGGMSNEDTFAGDRS